MGEEPTRRAGAGVLIAAGVAGVVVCVALPHYRPRRAAPVSSPSAPPTRPAPAQAPLAAGKPVDLSSDEPLRPMGAAPVGEACGKDGAYFEIRVVANVLGQPYQLWKLDERACPSGSTPVPMLRYYQPWAVKFGLDACYCRPAAGDVGHGL